jgi:SAM-dependent methyltransferase
MNEDTRKNMAAWDAACAVYQQHNAARLPTDEPTWGVWGIPERELKVLGEVAGTDVLELGCGGAQWSIALARKGARATGLDVSEVQLVFARDLVKRAGVEVKLVKAAAEATGLPGASFDLLMADHGAPDYTDPAAWVPEAARLLRPGGRLVFNAVTPWQHICFDPAANTVEARLVDGYFGVKRYVDEGMVEFMFGYGDWIRLFRANGFVVEDLLELQAPEGATTTHDGYAPAGWARLWPSEQIWKVRKQG